MRRSSLGCLVLLVAAAAGSVSQAYSGGPALDPALRALLARAAVTSAPPSQTAPGSLPRTFSAPLTAPIPESPRWDLFLEAGPGGLAPAPGLELYPLGEGRYGARADLGALRRLLDEGRVTGARLSRPVHFALDLSARHLGLPPLRHVDDNGVFRGATGRGVLVGTVDSGVDWTHPDFHRPDGSSRLTRYWDQLGRGFTSPADFPFGSEYTDRLIDLGIVGGMDENGHGTHVLGILAGNGTGGDRRYVGIAPEATLTAVRTNFTELGVVLGAQYFFQRAQAQGMPAVLNLSLGNHFGPHRGTTPFEVSLAALVGPGRLLVAAAGNDGSDDAHAEMHVAFGVTQDLALVVPSYERVPQTYPYASFEAWFDRADRYRFTVLDPQGTEVGTFIPGMEGRTFDGVRGVVAGWYVDDLGMSTLFIEIQDNPASNRLATGTWKVRVERTEAGGGGEIDAWMVGWAYFRDHAAPRFTSHVDREETIISPATSPRILAVGAVATRACWVDAAGESVCYAVPPVLGEPAYFSSRGPTSDGTAKPEILAPGFGVVSARSSGISPDVASPEELDRITSPDGKYLVSQGTSMAAPHAAGAAALLLERFPELTFEQLVSRLAGRGRRLYDARTGSEARELQIAEALAPAVTVSLSELIPDPGGTRIRWLVGKERSPVVYTVYKGFSADGPFVRLTPRLVAKGPIYEALDRRLEPGRTHFYRISTLDPYGLEEDLDTLRADVPGVPVFAFRAPDPNPVRDRLNLRAYFPPSSQGGAFALEVYDVLGRRVARADQGAFPAEGEERLSHWDLRDEGGARVSGGVYLIRMRASFHQGTSLEAIRRVVVLP